VYRLKRALLRFGAQPSTGSRLVPAEIIFGFPWKARAAGVYSFASLLFASGGRPDCKDRPEEGKESTMSANLPAPRIGIVGTEAVSHNESRGCYLWPPGYAAAVTAAGGEPTFVQLPRSAETWDDCLPGIEGVLLLGQATATARQAALQAKLCDWCRKRQKPLLAVDRGLLVLNTAFGGTLFTDLAREQPQALQHRHPPERGLRHAINVEPGTRLSGIYGEGEIVVNSEHREAVSRIARGFRVCARALDGVTEAIEAESDRWFALGVQWQPASASASGLDIQLFRGLVGACQSKLECVPAGAAA
jgi:putative glutamine amidotransferase